MNALASPLLAASASISFALGAAHLLITFRGDKLYPETPRCTPGLRDVSPVITSETTMWKAWVGFNACHSR